jgi:NAD(P)-dependent dehydrogenase (short-subunit alcohol dehydrogenase family)
MVEKRVAVVTGASQGLGLETVRGLAGRGLHIVLTARTESAVAKGLAALDGGDVEGRTLDVGDDDSVAAFFDWLEGSHGRIDALVNNAGRLTGSYNESLSEVAPADVIALLDNNAMSALRTTARALAMMNAAGYGRIVNVSSAMGQLSDMGGGSVAYRVSKAALNVITRVGHAEAVKNVKVNSVCPGWVRTDMGGSSAPRTLEEGASGIVWAATLPANGPSGGFFRDGKRIEW